MHALDHVVFNTRDRTDQVLALFAGLGFTVGQRGFHTLGSINHTIVFGADYLELLGYPPGAPPPGRPELVERPIGLMATVLRSADAQATRDELLRRGLAPRPVQAFSRPVALPDGRVEGAAFRVTRLEPDAVPGTWFYYCQHLTPQWVWRPEWQVHANRASAICALSIAVPDPAAALPAYRACAGLPDTDRDATAGETEIMLGDCRLQLDRSGDTPGMKAIGFRVDSLDAVKSAARRAGIGFESGATQLHIDPAASFGAKLQFIVQAG